MKTGLEGLSLREKRTGVAGRNVPLRRVAQDAVWPGPGRRLPCDLKLFE
jgi:hypothetical protein